MAANNIIGDDTMINSRDPTMSMVRFINAFPKLSKGMRRRLIIGRKET